jgi:HK97 family phage major capsid protein
MGEKITTQEQFRAALRDAVPDLIRENPEVFVTAMAGDREKFAEALRGAGFVVGQQDMQAAMVAAKVAQEEAITDGRVTNGFGAREMEAVRHLGRRVRGFDGRMRTTFLGERELMQAAESWFRALMNGGNDPVSRKSIHEIADGINRGVRAPSTPLSGDIGTAGGHLVPSPIVAEIFMEMNERFVLGSWVSVYRSAAPLRFLRRLSQITLSRGGNAGDISEKDFGGTLGSITLSANRVSAITYVDPQLANAAVIGPVQYVIGQFAEAWAKDVQRVIVAGDRASLEPVGINTLPTSGGNAYDRAKTATFVGTDNATVRNSVRSGYYQLSQMARESSKFLWIGNADVISKLASTNDTNQQLFRDAAAGSMPTFMNKPIVETSAIVTAGGNATLLGADMSQYAWIEGAQGLRMEQTTEGGQAWASDTIGIKLVAWVDGAPIIPPSFLIIPSFAV